MNTLIAYAISFVGLPYIWGGNNPLLGFDCSGLVQEILASVNMDPKGRDTAQGLYDHFSKNSIFALQTPTPGALVFYGKSLTEISHVAFMLDSNRIIEAGSGNHTTLTREVATAQNAFVRVRHYTYRGDLVAIVMPNYPFWMQSMTINLMGQ